MMLWLPNAPDGLCAPPNGCEAPPPQASDDDRCAFPPNLSNHDRAVVHAECRKYGFTSKSYGKVRCISGVAHGTVPQQLASHHRGSTAPLRSSRIGARWRP